LKIGLKNNSRNNSIHPLTLFKLCRIFIIETTSDRSGGVEKNTMISKSVVIKETGIPSSHIDWIWKKGLLTYDDQVGRQFRRDYEVGMIFELYAIERLRRYGVPLSHIKEFLIFLKKLLKNKNSDTTQIELFSEPEKDTVLQQAESKVLQYTFNPYIAQFAGDEVATAVIHNYSWYYLDVRKDGKKTEIGKVLKLDSSPSGKVVRKKIYTVDEESTISPPAAGLDSLSRKQLAVEITGNGIIDHLSDPEEDLTMFSIHLNNIGILSR